MRVGKDTNRLADTDLTDEDDDQTTVIHYPAPDPKCRGCDEHVSCRRHWRYEACRERAERRARRPLPA